MPVVDIWEMWMAVANALVRMPVRMRLAGRRGLVVVVAMVLVMHITVYWSTT